MILNGLVCWWSRAHYPGNFSFSTSCLLAVFTFHHFTVSFFSNNLKIQRGEAKVRELSLSLAGGGRCGAVLPLYNTEWKLRRKPSEIWARFYSQNLSVTISRHSGVPESDSGTDIASFHACKQIPILLRVDFATFWVDSVSSILLLIWVLWSEHRLSHWVADSHLNLLDDFEMECNVDSFCVSGIRMICTLIE